MPWAAEISGDDPYANYTSNLAGPQDYLRYLGPRVPTSLSQFADELVTEEWEDVAREVGAVAGGALGALVVPSVLQALSRHTRGYEVPLGAGSALVGLILGGMFGYWQPKVSTITQSVLLLGTL